ncbi:MAG: beta-ketoacyl synthase N-terminal-like domain-containing protein [Acidobacteriota bacterium]
MSSAPPSIVITGMGVLSAEGVGRAPLAAALAAGRGSRRPMEPFAGLPPRDGAATLAGRLPTVPFQQWIPPLVGRRMSPPSRFAVTAARLALDEAGYDLPETPDRDTGVVSATAFGPMSFTERLLDQVFGEGPAAASPFLFTECVANAPAAQISIQCRLAGPNLTVCQREASPLLMMARGAGELRAGRAGRMVVAAVEEMTPLIFAVLDRFRALARPCDGVEEARPFDRRRNGFIASEGATVLVLEPEERAGERGRLRLAAWGSAFDGTAGRSGWGRGDALLATQIRRGLERFGLSPGDLDLVISGASGSRAGDRLEGAVLRRLAVPGPVLAPKGVTGEYGGAFLAAAVLAMEGCPCGPTAGFREVDPAIALVPHDGSPLASPRRALVTSFAAGGAVSWLVLEALR